MGPWDRLVENISSKLAFFPPTPATYAVREHQDGTGEQYIQPLSPDVPKVLQCKVKIIPVPPFKRGGGGTNIVTAFFRYGSHSRSSHASSGAGGASSSAATAAASSSAASRLTLLYSHGNAVDLGHMLPVYRELSRLLKVNVMGYDYSGYGCSTGSPTVNNTLADITAVLACLQDTYGIPAGRVVLYGQSVGSGPSCYLGAERADLAGVVLHSPLLSGVRVLKPHVRWWPAWADVYPNHTLAPKIKSPVLVMHGTEDEVIHISCGKRLHELCPNKATPLWAAGYGHQDLEMCSGYLPTLENFLAKVAGQQYLQMPAGPGAAGPSVVAQQQQQQQQGQAVGGAPAPAAAAAAAGAAAQQRAAATASGAGAGGSGSASTPSGAGQAGAGSGGAGALNGQNGHQATGAGTAGGPPASASGGRR
ncbi:hypothetical protein HYH02_009984 [Chlamydomonas schloesseri]|uniref:Serine aminopeptidase S33 domain-containing protein n=1 Tax=Chlamydomonas schloesseri TaxID=2026947 RepID=A0A835TP29_9CHLO|nr:hypothetical protein HYH02_009984 [Chlamydomonas schloesseri]|eukprot:KAG2441395.1 hypothetical protein HYH02_009984 [Chlamydomonas schloesseri]